MVHNRHICNYFTLNCCRSSLSYSNILMINKGAITNFSISINIPTLLPFPCSRLPQPFWNISSLFLTCKKHNYNPLQWYDIYLHFERFQMKNYIRKQANGNILPKYNIHTYTLECLYLSKYRTSAQTYHTNMDKANNSAVLTSLRQQNYLPRHLY